jgi:hypothetical protein
MMGHTRLPPAEHVVPEFSSSKKSIHRPFFVRHVIKKFAHDLLNRHPPAMPASHCDGWSPRENDRNVMTSQRGGDRQWRQIYQETYHMSCLYIVKSYNIQLFSSWLQMIMLVQCKTVSVMLQFAMIPAFLRPFCVNWKESGRQINFIHHYLYCVNNTGYLL